MATTSVGGARPRRAASCRPYRLGVLLRVLDPENPSPPDAGDALLTLELPPGRWVPPPMLVRADLSLFVLSGVLLASRPAPRGPRVDLQFPSELVGLDTLPARRWQVISQHPARLAVVAATGLDSLGATPGGTVALLAAGQRQLERARDLHAIVGIQRIEERITAYFAFLAAQVGVPCDDGGIRIPLTLKQKRIEEILSAGHTQATMAFRVLFASGVLEQDGDGWRFTPRRSVPNRSRPALGAAPNSFAGIASNALSQTPVGS